MLNLETIRELESENGGSCPTCHQGIRIYEHAPNANHVTILQRMAAVVNETGVNEINFHDIQGEFQDKSQRSKMRQAGFIAKVKRDDVHVRNTWLITRKGWQFLAGKEIPRTTIVYNNTVLGHSDDVITITDVKRDHTPSDLMYSMAKITPTESRQYSQVREGVKKMVYMAKYRGPIKENKDKIFRITIDRLQQGKPINVDIEGRDAVVRYPDVASFAKRWKIMEEVK